MAAPETGSSAALLHGAILKMIHSAADITEHRALEQVDADVSAIDRLPNVAEHEKGGTP
jgi:hypothetical protein